LRAELDYRQPIDLGEAIELALWDHHIAFLGGTAVRAVAAVASAPTD
jgi:hypothetical protein